MAFTIVTVTATYLRPDGGVASGVVTFQPLVEMTNGADIRVPALETAVLDEVTGAISIQLPATDDPGTVPTGNAYTVREVISGTSRDWLLVVPHASPTLDLSSAAPAQPEPLYYYALDAAVVHNTGNETVAGTKTFTSAPVVPAASFPESAVSGLPADLAARAIDSTVVHNSGVETVAGVKTFTSPPIVPSAAFPESAVANLVSDLAAKAADNAVVHLTGNETVGGTKTFSAAPVVPAAAFPESAVANLTADLAAKAADSAVVHNTGPETIAGVKTFSSSPVVPSSAFPESAVANLTTDLAAKATDSLVVHLAGTEALTGQKSFSAAVFMGSGHPWYDVRHPSFAGGAAGNGSGDDGPAINAAITAANAGGGGVVFIGPGNYRFTTQIVLKSRVSVWVHHPGATTLTWAGSAGQDAIAAVGSAGTPLQNVALLGLNVTGSTGSGSGKLVNVTHCQGLRIDNCYLNSTGTSASDGAALFIGGKLNDIKITRSVLTSSAIYTLYHNSGQVTDDLTIDNCALSSTYAGTAVTGVLTFSSSGTCSRYTVSNCRIGPGPMTGATFQGVFLAPSFINVKVSGCRGLGLELSNGVVRASIADCEVDYTGVTPLSNGWAFSIGGTQPRVTGVTVLGVVGMPLGIEIVNATDAVVSGFTLLNCDKAIIVNNSPRTALGPGVIDTTQTDGIHVYGGASGGMSSDDTVIHGVTIRNVGQASSSAANVSGIEIDNGGGSAKRIVVSGFVINGGAKPSGSSGFYGIKVNDLGARITNGQILNLTSPDGIIGFFGAGVASSAKVSSVGGYNPLGSLTPPTPTLGTELVNPFPHDVMVSVTGGTVTGIAFGASGATVATNLTSGVFFWPAGGYMKISGSVLPTLVCYGL